MPIQFHCDRCGQLLSISRRMAGTNTECPACSESIIVPDPNAPTPKAVEVVNPWEEEEEPPGLIASRRGVEESGLDMTPMVDVVMLLLIFFMITASFVTQKSLETAPPQSEAGGKQAAPADDLGGSSIVVSIDEENNITVGDTPVTGTPELIEVLKAKMTEEKKNEMLIEADPAATHGTVVAVTDAGIEARMQRIRHSFKRGAH